MATTKTKAKAKVNKNPAPEPAAIPGPNADAPKSVAASGMDEFTAMMVGTGTVTAPEPAKSKSKLPVIRLEDVLKPRVDEKGDPIADSSVQDRFIKANADKKDADARIKDLGALIKKPALEALLKYCREARSFSVSASVNGRLTFTSGRYEPVSPSVDLSFVAQVEQLSKLFGATSFQRTFGSEPTLQIKPTLLENPAQAKVVVSKLKELVGAENFANWFAFEPSLYMKREADEQVLQRDAAMDPDVKTKAEAACAMGLIKLYESIIKT
jgi:hypothetical protein